MRTNLNIVGKTFSKRSYVLRHMKENCSKITAKNKIFGQNSVMALFYDNL